jgi:hypothetical protein
MLSVKAHSILPVYAITATNVMMVAAMRHVMDLVKVLAWVSWDLWGFMGFTWGIIDIMLYYNYFVII